MIFDKKKRLSTIKKYPDGAAKFHWEKRKGTRDDARTYCMKDDTRTDGPCELGVFPVSEQGKRSDLARIAELLTSGTSVRELYQDSANASTLIRYGRHIDNFVSRRLQYQPRPVPDVVLCYGPTGCGKTSFAFELDPELYRVPIGNNIWFNGYTGEKTILWDEFSGASSHCRLDYFLQFADRYALQVGTKGGHTSPLASTIIFSSNNHPTTWWDSLDDSRSTPQWSDVSLEFSGGSQPTQMITSSLRLPDRDWETHHVVG